MENIIIKSRRGKDIWFAVVSLLVVAMLTAWFAVLITKKWQYTHSVVISFVFKLFLYLGLIIAIALLVIVFVFQVCKIFSTEPLLIIDENGITNNSNIFPTVFIPWENIDEMYVYETNNQKLIGVTLINTDVWLEGLPKYHQMSVKANLKTGSFPPISISLRTAKEKPEDIYDIMVKYDLNKVADSPSLDFTGRDIK